MKKFKITATLCEYIEAESEEEAWNFIDKWSRNSSMSYVMEILSQDGVMEEITEFPANADPLKQRR